MTRHAHPHRGSGCMIENLLLYILPLEGCPNMEAYSTL